LPASHNTPVPVITRDVMGLAIRIQTKWKSRHKTGTDFDLNHHMGQAPCHFAPKGAKLATTGNRGTVRKHASSGM